MAGNSKKLKKKPSRRSLRRPSPEKVMTTSFFSSTPFGRHLVLDAQSDQQSYDGKIDKPQHAPDILAPIVGLRTGSLRIEEVVIHPQRGLHAAKNDTDDDAWIIPRHHVKKADLVSKANHSYPPNTQISQGRRLCRWQSIMYPS